MGSWSYLQSLASDRMRWLSARQTVISSNVANANTPEYRPVDVVPFNSYLETRGGTTSATSAGAGRNPAMADPMSAERPVEVRATEPDEAIGHSVEDEMIRSAEVHRDFSLAASIIKAQHRMLLATLKG